jgi:Zn-dependent protease with chaperone function
MGRKWFFIIGVYVVIYTSLNFLIDLPLDVYQEFIRQHAYELSNQSFSQWLTDSMKSLMIVTIVGALFLWIPYLLLKKSPRRWWFYTAMASVPFLLLFMLIQPIWIAPLFDEFGPMQDKGLEQKILQLADRAGIEGGNVFEVNKSEDTKMLNGYVAGLLNTKRIVLWDTLTEKLNPDQVLVVMGHEMGHYVLGHTWKLVLFFSLLILVILYAVHRTAATMIDRFQHRFGFDKLSDIASLPLLVLLFSVFLLAATPIAFTFTRHLELEADRFGLEITQDNHAMATGLLFLHNQNLRHPRPGILYKLWRSWHPVLADRIEFANTYKPWETGSKLKYANYFRRE